jgi:hypothetical protein
MALDTNFNINPYYDDFDETKSFLRLLFKPGYAVQARELTQLQTLLQNQVERFGNHVFQNGSIVTGGQQFLQEATYLKLNTSYANNDINVSSFEGMTIYSSDESKRGEVLKAYDANEGTSDPKTLMIKQLYGSPFVSGETIKTDEVSPLLANIATLGVGTGQVFSINEGVFYYDGFFIQNNPQTIATSKYTNTANARIGFEITESIVTNNQDTTLLDPAQDASNYQAPGSDRYRVSLVLATRSLDSIDDTQFIELMRVENGQITSQVKYPLYSVLEDTLARRTYDESGNYIVKPFTIAVETNSANAAQTDIVLSPGKAYVYGYEFETNGPTRLTVDKPRTTSDISNKIINSDYGNFIYTTNHFGSFPINSLQTIDLHCVNVSSINTTTTASISNTKIGTVRVKSLAFDTASNTSNSQTYQYKTFIFDVDVGSITGTVNTATSNTVIIGNTSGGQVYSTINDAYLGGKLRIVSGTGSTEFPKTIIGFNGTTQTLTLDSEFTTLPSNTSVFAIDFEFNDMESMSLHSSTTMIAGANISSRSKDLATPFEDVIISESSFEPLIFRLGEEYVAQNSISDMAFSYKRLYSSQSFSSSLSPSLPVGTGEDIATASSTTSKLQKYYITVTTQGTSPYSVGSLIPSDKFTVDGSTNRITVQSGNNMVANIIATLDVSTVTQKNKTYVAANTTIQTTSGEDVYSNSAVISYPLQGQCHIANTFVIKTPDVAQSLYVSDVIEITKILDFQGNGVSEANSVVAANVTTSYVLDNGQRDSFYGHASIKLKSGSVAPIGPLVVFYNRFSSSGSGFFSVDSYSDISYDNISTYSSPTNNSLYELRDCLDFRPVRFDAASGTGDTVTFNVDPTTTGPKIPENGSSIVLDYNFYLPRVDKVVIDKTKKFQVIKGDPDLIPMSPADTSTGMTIFVLSYSPYLADIRDINIQQINHKRYTMRDIGIIDKRVENLEYYTSLSLLEQETVVKQDLTILDTQNLPRFKNGIVVDAFKGHSVADVTNADYRASIDVVNKELRPAFNISAHRLNFDSANSTNFQQIGSLVTGNSSSVVLVDQPKATRFINVNPFNVINYLGKIKLSPQSDIWVDEQTQPDVLINIGGDRDAWALITANNFSYQWNSWNTLWTGVNTNVTTNWIGNSLVETTTTTTNQNQTRTGVLSTVVPETITASIGDRVVDVSIIPYMRTINMLFVGTDFKPSTTLYPFFDNRPVENYVGNRVNKLFLTTNNVDFRVDLSNPEIIEIRNADTPGGNANATGIVAHVSNNIVYVTNVLPSTNLNFANLVVTGVESGLSYTATGYEHNGGSCIAATSNTITFRADAIGAINQNSYVGSTIFLVQGSGLGQSSNIVAYNVSTGVATVSPSWTTLPVANETFYSVGRTQTDVSGSAVGIFTVPNGIFRIGEKLFRLTDTATGDIPSSSTNGDASFFAQGLLQTKQDTIISTIAPVVQRTSLNEDRVVSSTTTNQRTIRVQQWSDPLAETFLISPQQYPEGVFLSKVRFCFKSKDDVIPITLQVRPTLNGYPSASVVYPFSTVSLTPNKVNVTSAPDLDDPLKYTDFVFDTPIYVQPGEHSFVLLANSNKYEAYIAEIGKLDLTTGRQVSEQAYGGSLFLSQNGSTWTADQSSDLMFRIFRNDFTTDAIETQFTVDDPIADVPYNTLQLITSDIVIANTSLNYQYNTEKETGGFVGFQNIIPLMNYELTDSNATRILNDTTGNTTFVLKGQMQSVSSAISPAIDISRVGIITVENRINNLGLSNSGISILNVGSGYANSSDVTVTISGGNGSGATAVANVVQNTIDAIYITNSGSGYTETPTISITAGSGGGSNASSVYSGETSKSGGNADAKYITRRVTLSDGFDSGDLRVYLTAYKPQGTNILVYYKILSASDPELFDDKEWKLMTQLGNENYFAINNNDYRELTFAPGSNGIPSNSVNYSLGNTSFSSFRTFAIKIVMTSETKSIVPKVKDFRTIALPAG